MRNNRISLQDIASLAGVSKMTVSRYLRDANKVAPETRTKIVEILDEMKYVPSRALNIMVSSKSNAIGVLIPSFQNQVFSDMLSGLEFITNQHGYQLLISEYNYSREREEKQILNLLSYDIEGLVLCEKNHTLRAKSYLISKKIPVIEIMDTLDHQLDIEIGFDNKLAAYHMTNTMISSGKTNILYFGSRNDQRDNQRYMGYHMAMQQHNLKALRVLPNSISSFSLGATMLKEVLREGRILDGVFCTNDDIAVGVLQECLRLGIRVPQDMAIAGFHGLDIGKAVTPMLASVITPRFEIGKRAAEVIINKMNGVNDSKSYDLGFKIFRGETI